MADTFVSAIIFMQLQEEDDARGYFYRRKACLHLSVDGNCYLVNRSNIILNFGGNGYCAEKPGVYIIEKKHSNISVVYQIRLERR